MLSPREINEMRFVKAVFGGYSVPEMNDFLDRLKADYAALYEENAALKRKLKIITEKE